MTSREEIINSLNACMDVRRSGLWSFGCAFCSYAKQSNPKCFMNLTKDAIALLREKPERKHGHWVFDPDGMDWNIPAWKCSECHCRNNNIPANLERTNPLLWSGSKFCPNCGAFMDEGVTQDEQNSDIHRSSDVPRL